MKRALLLASTCLLALGAHAATFYVIVAGLGGEPDYEQRFTAAANNLDRIFKPLFTTKARGMGMGLSICRSIIGAHGGRIWASAGAARGSIFEFELPTKALGSDVPASVFASADEAIE